VGVLCSFSLSAEEGLIYKNIIVGHWYNFYFQEGLSPFPVLNKKGDHYSSIAKVHAAKIVSNQSPKNIKIYFPKRAKDNVAILSARMKDEKIPSSFGGWPRF